MFKGCVYLSRRPRFFFNQSVTGCRRTRLLELLVKWRWDASYWIIRYSMRKSSFHVQVGGTLQRLLAGNRHSTILSEMETVQSKESCKKFGEYIVKEFQRCVDSGGALVKTLCTIAKMQSCSWMACRLQSKRTKRQNQPSKTQAPLVSTLVVAEWVCCSLTCACRVKIPQQW